jgi:hypothetical protein
MIHSSRFMIQIYMYMYVAIERGKARCKRDYGSQMYNRH